MYGQNHSYLALTQTHPTADNATGPFHVEFYVTNGEDMPEKLGQFNSQTVTLHMRCLMSGTEIGNAATSIAFVRRESLCEFPSRPGGRRSPSGIPPIVLNIFYEFSGTEQAGRLGGYVSPLPARCKDRGGQVVFPDRATHLLCSVRY